MKPLVKFSTWVHNPMTLKETAEIMCQGIKGGSFHLVHFPEDRKAIDVGDFICDYNLFCSTFGWKPKISFEKESRHRSNILNLRSNTIFKMIPFGDPSASYKAHKEELDKAIHRVLDSGWYVLGKRK